MTGLPIAGLEQVYDEIALALDRVGPDKGELMLAKLALLLADAVGDAQRVTELVEVATRDL